MNAESHQRRATLAPSAISGGEEEHGTGSTDGRSTGTAGRARQTLIASRHSLRTLRGRHSTTEPIRVGHRIQRTSAPGLAAKDCIDVQIRVRSIDEARDIALLSAIGFRCRPEPWNRTEVSGWIPCRKLVFAPPVGAGTCNVRLREGAGPKARPGPHRRPRDQGWRLLHQLPVSDADIAPTRTPRAHSMISIMGNPCASP
ncbi:GrpB family protein [Streptomyces sp. NPDC056910]|uniref:GrpB family protein n=1 Tax=Streptomyces sp. NPDC056910 TaxID=3345964 RepID=UPI00369A3C4E